MSERKRLISFSTFVTYNQVDSSRLVMQDFIVFLREWKIFDSCLDDQVDGFLHLAANGVQKFYFLFSRPGYVCVLNLKEFHTKKPDTLSLLSIPDVEDLQG